MVLLVCQKNSVLNLLLRIFKIWEIIIYFSILLHLGCMLKIIEIDIFSSLYN